MDASAVAWSLAAFFAAAFLKGLTGLGFSTICLGLLAAVLPVKVAIPLVIVPSLSSNLLVMREVGRFREALRRFWPLYAASVPGLGLGLWLLAGAAGGPVRVVLGAVLFLYGAYGLAARPARLAPALETGLGPPVGFATGLINGLTGSQVMPLLPYMLALGIGRDLFVQAVNVSFTLSSILMLAGLGRIGLLGADVVAVAVAGVVPVWAGIRLGGMLRRRLGEAHFRALVMGLLVALGVLLAVRGVVEGA